jgi:hypothetical protein
MWQLDDFLDGDLYFRDNAHSYTWRGYPLTSATQFVEQFARPFDAKTHAETVSAREQVPVSTILDRWTEAGNNARTLGTTVHAFAEHNADCITRRGYHPAWEHTDDGLPYAGYCRSVQRFYDETPEFRYGWTIPEVKVCHPEHFLAGTVDLVCNYRGLRSILDFKTSRKISYWGWGETMYWPFNKLRDANFWHYTLQLSLYAMILEDRHGYDAEFLGVVWLSPDGYFRVHRCPRLDTHLLCKGIKKFWKKRNAQRDFSTLTVDGLLWNMGEI